MKIYNFDADTGVFIGSGIADPSPLEDGVYLIPAFATDIEPPSIKDNERVLFDGSAWNIEVIPPPPPVPAVPPPTNEQIIKTLTAAVQEHLDGVSASFGYDNIFTACTYAEEPSVPQFQAEGRALRSWRSRVWERCHEVLAEVEAGQRGIPTVEALIAELPALVLP